MSLLEFNKLISVLESPFYVTYDDIKISEK